MNLYYTFLICALGKQVLILWHENYQIRFMNISQKNNICIYWFTIRDQLYSFTFHFPPDRKYTVDLQYTFHHYRERLRAGVPAGQPVLQQDGAAEGATQPQRLGPGASRLLRHGHRLWSSLWAGGSSGSSGGWRKLVSQCWQLAGRSVDVMRWLWLQLAR